MPSSPWKRVMHPFSTRNPHCGCPLNNPFSKCHHCTAPDTLEVRILHPPTKCVKQPCNFIIPAVDCHEELKRKPVERYSYDLTVDEPGPNDSYGLNGLNWYDWKLDEYNKRNLVVESNQNIPDHPYLTKREIPDGFHNVHCQLPIECYSRSPEWIARTPFAQPVNYSRNWRCCNHLAPSPWKPPHANWATNQHL